jgi:ankyrin repeat protein
VRSGNFLVHCSDTRRSRTDRSLISRGVDVETKYKDGYTTPLLKASQRENLKVLTLLLEAGANPNASFRGRIGWNTEIDMTPLVFATKNNRTEFVKALLKYKATIPMYLIQKPRKVNNNDAVKILQAAYKEELSC